jgi:acyl-CoA thioesterase-1
MRCRRRRAAGFIGVLTLLVAVGCGRRQDLPAAPATDAAPTNTTAEAAPAAERPRIVALGDSLTAGYGLPPTQAYPSILQQRVDDLGLNYEVVNAGVSGDTSAGGLGRLDWALHGDVRVLLLALGANDGLRGLSPEQLRQNLARIIEQAQGRSITVVLAGMEAPPNYGRPYFLAFHQVYPLLAEQYRVALVPFLLEGVAGIDRLNQGDLLHPNAEGTRIVADNIWKVLQPIVEAKP